MTRTLRGETPDGASYFLVEEVAITKATERNGAYVPEAELRASVERWVDVPVTLNHPRSEDGTLLSIRYDDELRAEHELGRVVFQGAVAAEPVEPGGTSRRDDLRHRRGGRQARHYARTLR